MEEFEGRAERELEFEELVVDDDAEFNISCGISGSEENEAFAATRDCGGRDEEAASLSVERREEEICCPNEERPKNDGRRLNCGVRRSIVSAADVDWVEEENTLVREDKMDEFCWRQDGTRETPEAKCMLFEGCSRDTTSEETGSKEAKEE